MKVVLFVHSLGGGGAEKVFVNLANQFVKDGHDVSVLLCNEVGTNIKFLDENIQVFSFSRSEKTIQAIICSYKFFFYLFRLRPDVVLSTLELPNLINVLFTKIYNLVFRDSVKIVTREANTLTSLDGESTNQYYFRVMDYLYTKFCGNADFVIANSPDTMKEVIKFRCVPEYKIDYIFNPINIGEYKRKNTCVGAQNRLISVGRLSRQKNHDFLFEVVRHLKISGTPVTLDIFGTGPLKEALLERISLLGLSDCISLKGYSDQIPYENYDAFVLPSLWEGFGNVIVEALAAGLPVVCSDCSGGPKYIINSPVLGELSPLEVAQFSNSLIKMLPRNGKDEIDARINRSKDFSVKTISNKYINVLSEVING